MRTPIKKDHAAVATELYQNFLDKGRLIIRQKVDYGEGSDSGYVEAMGVRDIHYEGIARKSLFRVIFQSSFSRNGRLSQPPFRLTMSDPDNDSPSMAFRKIVTGWVDYGEPVVLSPRRTCLWLEPEQFVGCARLLPKPNGGLSSTFGAGHPLMFHHLLLYAGQLSGNSPYILPKLQTGALQGFIDSFHSFVGQEHVNNNCFLNEWRSSDEKAP